MEPFVLNEEQYREMFGDSDSNDESFYGLSDVESASSGAEEEGLGQEESLDGRGRQEDPAIGAYRYDSWLQEFTEETGVKADLGDSPSELEIFSKVFSDEVFQLMVTETNRYAHQEIEKIQASGNEPRQNSYAGKWFDVTLPEMKAFVAMILLMGIVKLPSYRMYWTTHDLLEFPAFKKIMARDRFLSILQFLHLANNEENLPRDNPDHNRLHKIQQFLDMIVPLWQGAYYPGRELAVDETLIAFKGRTHFKQYKPNKPHKWAINAWTLAESKTGYVYNWDIYEGKRRDGNAEIGLTHKVVTNLVEPVYERGHHVYMDNYFSSPALFDDLKNHQTGACGTFRTHRRGVPNEAATSKPKKGEPPVVTRDGETTFINWTDKRQVNVMTTIHNGETFQKKVRCRPNQGDDGNPWRFIEKPKAIELYSEFMGGVDRADQKAAYNVNLHRCTKWWKKAFFHMLEVAVVNAGIIYQAFYQPRVFNSRKFRINLIEQLLDGYERASYRPGRRSQDDHNPLRLSGRHFVGKVEGTSRPDCVVCSQRKDKDHPNGKRHQTQFSCKTC